MAKQPFRSIGQRLRAAAHSHINQYVSSGNVVSRVELPPSWQQNVEEPLVWREDAATPEAPTPTAETPEAAPVVTSQTDSVTSRLQRILQLHQEKEAREAAEKAKAEAAAAEPPPVQREAETGETTNEPPRPVTRRRRGAVIEVPSQTTPSDEETPPDFFFLNDPAPVQRATEAEAPQASTQQSDIPDDPETSFWRGLFTNTDQTPDISTERADEDSASFSEAYEEASPESGIEPTASGETQAVDAPTIQRTPEDSVEQHTPEIQRDVEQSPASAEDFYAPTDNYEADLPAGAEIAPPTPETPHVVQRQSVEQSHIIEEEPDYPAETFTASQPEPTAEPPVSSVAPDTTSQQVTTAQASPSIQRELEPPSEPVFEPPAEPTVLPTETTVPQVAETASQQEPTAEPPSVQREIDDALPIDQQYDTGQDDFSAQPEPSFMEEDQPAAEPSVDEVLASLSAPEAPVVQRQIEPEAIEDAFYPVEAEPAAYEPETAPTAFTESFTETETPITSQPAQPSVPSVQREVSQPSQSEPHFEQHEAVNDLADLPPDVYQPIAERPHIDQPAPIQRSVDEPVVSRADDEPATFTESQPTSEWQDALTMLTPAPEPQSPPPVQRTATTEEIEAPSEPEFTAADAPTMLTPTVQRETADTPETKPASRMPEPPPSPWLDFMNPAPRTSERIKRPAPPTIVQRTPETSKTNETAADTPADNYTAQENPSALPEQPVDLFTALLDAGAVNPAPPQISLQTAATPSNTTPPSPSRTESLGSGLERHIPDEGSIDAELLSLIDLPPNTPIIRQAPPEPSVSRAVEHTPEPAPNQTSNFTPPSDFTPPMVEQHTESLDTLMLERGAATPTSSVSTETEDEGGQSGDAGIDVDKLARDVMGVLRRRLRTEQERRGGKS